MSEAIIVALITGVFTIAAQLIISSRTKSDLYSKLDKQSAISDEKMNAKIERYAAVTDNKIDELTREVRDHNNFARRVPILEEQMRVVNERIKDISGKTGA